MWLGFAKRETEWVSNHKVNSPYRFTIGPSSEINDQGVPISIQKYIFPVIIDGKLVIYESTPGTDFNSKNYKNIEETDFDAIGYIPKLRVWEPYLLTSDKINYQNKAILLQKYLFMDEEMNVYESVLCSSLPHPDYPILPMINALEEQSEAFWLESELSLIHI